MKLHFAYSTNTTNSASKELAFTRQQISTVLPDIKRVIVVSGQPQKADRGVSIDDLIAELAQDPSIHAELAIARQELGQSTGNAPATLSDMRLRLGLSQRELAARSGLHQPNISAIESGKRKPDYDTATRLADALNMSIEDVYVSYAVGNQKL